ncbi:MAG: ABC transporter permease [Acidimicrobiia bacterium]|nr:ABC transporter permease [Acidimicrobiia bacterium]
MSTEVRAGNPTGPEPGDDVDDDGALAVGAEAVARSQWQLFRRRFLRHKLAMTGLVILATMFVLCFGARWIAPYPKNNQDLLSDPVGPGRDHLFGQDELGRDYFTEVLYAGQISLKIGLAVAVLSTALGATLGSVAGYFGRAYDLILMRITDMFLLVPGVALLAVAFRKFGQSDLAIIVVLTGIGWMLVARVVRGQVLSLRDREFVDAAKVAGASPFRIIFRHLIPNMVGPIAVNATLSMVGAILAESTLSFLGFGIQPPDTSWGNLLAQNRGYLGLSKAYLLYFPSIAIVLAVLAISFVGDGLRDAFDPESQR